MVTNLSFKIWFNKNSDEIGLARTCRNWQTALFIQNLYKLGQLRSSTEPFTRESAQEAQQQSQEESQQSFTPHWGQEKW